MGVKSTVTLSRSTAESKYVDLVLDEQIERLKRSIRSSVVLMSNSALEDALERENDKANDGEGFENYIIQD